MIDPSRRHERPRRLAAPLVVCLVLLTAVVTAGTAEASEVPSSQSSAVASDLVTVTAQGAYRFQGWGTSLAWWANVVGGWSLPNRERMEKELFDRPDAEHPDRLGLNVVRYNVGASSTTGNPPVAANMPNCLPFGPGKAVPTTMPGSGQPVNLELDANQVRVLTEARRRIGSPAVLEAFANSPPWWMTDNQCPQGSRTPFTDNLSPARDGDYADYLAQVLSAFRARGVDFQTVEPLNEPEAPWGALPCSNGCQEGAHFDPFSGHQSQVLLQLCGRLRDSGLGTRISTPDGFNPEFTLGQVNLLTPEARACLAQVNTHVYSLVGTDLVPYRGAGRRALAGFGAATSRPVWMSEVGTGGPAADLQNALTYSLEIARDLRYLRPAAWVNWQAVEATGGWGLFEAPQWPVEARAPGATRPVVETRRFFTLEQYSRFIRPGFTILTANDSRDDVDHETTPTMAAVDNPRAPRRVVIVSTTSSDRNVDFDLGPLGISRLGAGARLTRYRTSPTGNVRRLDPRPVPVFGGRFSDAQPASSITTYVVDVPR
jgi:O-glycosyl hydrolase